MKRMWSVFAAVFISGISSLLMELSLLREFVFVIGSSAFSNSLIISVFLAGLAAGTYAGSAKKLKSGSESGARRKFAVTQLLFIGFVFVFYLTKDYFIYVSMSQPLILAYFVAATFLPSFLSGLAYTAMVELTYHKGERYIVYIYAVSTLGNVIGGLLHGYVFVYLTGIQASYAVASLCAAVSLLFVYRIQKTGALIASAGLLLIPSGLIAGNSINARLYVFRDLLFRKYSPSGLVEVWRTPDGQAVEMTVNNVHEYYSYDWDRDVHRQWAETSMELAGSGADILLLGYGSGVSTDAYLSNPDVASVDTVENTAPVIDAGKRFFPDEYRRIAGDPRSRIIMQDFRRYIRFTGKRYDVVLLDHSIIDPYYSGFFTLEFFDQLKRILKPGGVIASLGVGLSWDTMQQSFPYIYRYVRPGRELISESGFFLMTSPMSERLAEAYVREENNPGGTPVYSDHNVWGGSVENALSAIKRRVSRSVF